MRRVGYSWWELLAWIAGLTVIVMCLLPSTKGVRDTSPPPPCRNNLQQISMALMQYCQDSDNRLPPVGKASEASLKPVHGWANALWPYIKQMRCYQCPQGNAAVYGRTDYWFNTNLSASNTRKLANAYVPNIIVFGDGNDAKTETTASYNLNSLPAEWIKDRKSPVYRHKGMANYAFLDGHIKALAPDQVTNEPLANGKPTFAVK